MQRFRDWFGDGSVHVLDVPLACCALESQAAGLGDVVTDLPDDSTLVLTLSGTITHAVAPALRALVEGLPRSPVVVSFGSCACVGGPYWDSYAVAKGAGDLGFEVHHFIPGCPPPPEALRSVIEAVRGG